ncbi:DUF1499 domain-containing protein [Halomonas beimenensis]|uniref:DUF1499 domain-containing protein n=1 Tax=Halomonas beimenensis TaxID=475662 RepID=A0A291P3S4_9GAMM|nr:DUF1499 domain-containing protein [Halomonas beimenensis]ATJ81522.1 hypothetical protein BEI_0535 [Halomonas beimenensis]
MASLSFKPRPRGGRWPVALAWLSVLLLGVAAALIGGAGPAYRMEWLSLGESFSLLRRGAQLAAGAGALGGLTFLVAGFCRRWKPTLVSVLVVAAVVGMVAVPWQHMQRGQRVPPIHDITTDLADPPAFEALAEARRAAPNEVDYPPGFAAQQRAAYPMLEPLVLDRPLAEVRAAVEATARAQGWEIAAVTERRLEAVATTRWFGFRDDVVIRLTETDAGVEVDVRSASRIGRSDLGTNAARIQGYLEALESRLGS